MLVLTTSYPRDDSDPAGSFVAASVTAAREAGFEVVVVSPADFRHYGVAYGYGIVGNLRAKPWLLFTMPLFLWRFRRAAARAASDADLLHAHWLLAGAIAATLRRPFVLQVWGTDLELARRAAPLTRWILRRARLTIAASGYLAQRAEALGAPLVEVVPSRVRIPDRVGQPDQPPHVLFLGRLSSEKGVLEFLEATEGMARVIVGDGPLRAAVPEAVGAVPPAGVGPYYERAAVVCCPSRREGYGMAAREAMAWGRPVVATAVGGLLDAVEDGVDGLLVPSGDVALLRRAIERLLADSALRERLGAAARERILSIDAESTTALERAYRDVLGRRDA